ncbi:unnamed protein product, partial [Linum tenue]
RLVKPRSFASHLLYSPLPSSSISLTTVALFKYKTKAAPKKAPPPKPKVEDGIFNLEHLGGLVSPSRMSSSWGMSPRLALRNLCLGKLLHGREFHPS